MKHLINPKFYFGMITVITILTMTLSFIGPLPVKAASSNNGQGAEYQPMFPGRPGGGGGNGGGHGGGDGNRGNGGEGNRGGNGGDHSADKVKEISSTEPEEGTDGETDTGDDTEELEPGVNPNGHAVDPLGDATNGNNGRSLISNDQNGTCPGNNGQGLGCRDISEDDGNTDGGDGSDGSTDGSGDDGSSDGSGGDGTEVVPPPVPEPAPTETEGSDVTSLWYMLLNFLGTPAQ